MARKEEVSEDIIVTDEIDAGVPRVYELGFHIDPELPHEEAKKVYHGVRDVIAASGTLVAEGEPEQIKLAYGISRQDHAGRRDFNSSYFAWIAYEADAEGHAKVGAKAREESRIFRYIDILTTKDAARHSSELRELKAKAPEQPEVATDAELDAVLADVAV